jgi:type II secretory pathway pseudopilin PulG
MEVLVVVVILGILAALLIVGFADATTEAAQKSFVTSLKTFAEAAELYRTKEGQYPPDGSTGLVPPGFEDYVDVRRYEMITVIGGRWDTELNDNGVTAAVGVHFNGDGMTQDDAYMSGVDAVFDDGDLTDGGFRKLADGRYYAVLAD